MSPFRRGFVAAVGGALLLGAASCRSGDLLGNATRNAVGGRGGAGDVVAAAVASIPDFFQQMSVRFSPEQEYYLGRGVAAQAIATYGLDPDEGRQAYVRKIGAALVEASPRIRATYGGYHFAVLASAEPNGLSGPGGFVFVTRGALDLARTEDEVAGVLAHEIAHVSLKHGEAIVRSSPGFATEMGALGRIAASATSRGQYQGQLARVFSESVVNFTKSLRETGYGRELEFKADAEGTYILYDAGYDASSISAYLAEMPGRAPSRWSAHPESRERIGALAPLVATWGGSFDGGLGLAARAARFRLALGR
jgi:predicted Zn-dependent protease